MADCLSVHYTTEVARLLNQQRSLLKAEMQGALTHARGQRGPWFRQYRTRLHHDAENPNAWLQNRKGRQSYD